jgi:hypothetical protein
MAIHAIAYEATPIYCDTRPLLLIVFDLASSVVANDMPSINEYI